MGHDDRYLDVLRYGSADEFMTATPRPSGGDGLG